MLEVFPKLMRSPSHAPSAFGLVLNLDKCYQVSTLSMNMIRSCSLQYGYSFKLENNGYSVYMNNTFHGHAPYVNGSVNLELWRSDGGPRFQQMARSHEIQDGIHVRKPGLDLGRLTSQSKGR